MFVSRRRQDVCRHPSTIQVVSNGLERVVCRECGHVTVRFESTITGDVDRAVFSRRADKLHVEQERDR